ncbi:MAG: hypothetical protein MRY63_05090 [Neomegalonema sp.]|nr:hypothetical protein [Neomegalonema sp.]
MRLIGDDARAKPGQPFAIETLVGADINRRASGVDQPGQKRQLKLTALPAQRPRHPAPRPIVQA